MKNKMNLLGVAMLASILFFGSCKEEETEPMNMKTLTVDISGLEDLGSTAVYEGWIIVNGNPVTTGTFTVDAQGNMSTSSFMVDGNDLDAATTFVLTIEPANDTDPAPSDIHLLAGDFGTSEADLSISHQAALNDDFMSARGFFFLATPTDTVSTNEASGVWFLNNLSGSPMPALDLPTLPNGWKYEGWVVIDGVPVSTGTFTEFNMADEAAPYSGTEPGPPFPGEDFLMNAPAGLTFPTDVRGGKVVVSIEPYPDNSADPFVLKPLLGDIDMHAMVHETQDLGNNLDFPTGMATR